MPPDTPAAVRCGTREFHAGERQHPREVEAARVAPLGPTRTPVDASVRWHDEQGMLTIWRHSAHTNSRKCPRSRSMEQREDGALHFLS